MKYIRKRISIAVLATLLILCFALSACNKDAGGPGATTTDMLFSHKNEYIGDASADGAILQALNVSALGKYDISLETDSQPYSLTVNFSEINVPADELNSKMEMYSYVLLALIGNADEISWNINADDVKDSKSVTIDDADKAYGNIRDCAASVENLHSLLTNIGYYN